MFESINDVKNRIKAKIVKFVEEYDPKTSIDRKIKYLILKRMILK